MFGSLQRVGVYANARDLLTKSGSGVNSVPRSDATIRLTHVCEAGFEGHLVSEGRSPRTIGQTGGGSSRKSARRGSGC